MIVRKRILPWRIGSVAVLSAARRPFLNTSTKEGVIGRQLDVFARRDPQLAPYLLREVDIEYQRRYTKFRFILWIAAFTALTLYNLRLHYEINYFLKPYAQRQEEHRRNEDRDFEIRQRWLVRILHLLEKVRHAPLNDQDLHDLFHVFNEKSESV